MRWLTGAIVLGFAHLIETVLFEVFSVGTEANELAHRVIILVGFLFIANGLRQLGKRIGVAEFVLHHQRLHHRVLGHAGEDGRYRAMRAHWGARAHAHFFWFYQVQAAAAFLSADAVDRLLIYRAPILIGGGKPGLGNIGLGSLADAHGQWRMTDRRVLGSDTLEVYERSLCSLE